LPIHQNSWHSGPVNLAKENSSAFSGSNQDEGSSFDRRACGRCISHGPSGSWHEVNEEHIDRRQQLQGDVESKKGFED
jgi:hypothetical protein